MIAQCRVFIVRTEQPALLEDRHDELNKVLEALVEISRHHVEAVGGMLVKLELKRVGDALGLAIGQSARSKWSVFRSAPARAQCARLSGHSGSAGWGIQFHHVSHALLRRFLNHA